MKQKQHTVHFMKVKA